MPSQIRSHGCSKIIVRHARMISNQSKTFGYLLLRDLDVAELGYLLFNKMPLDKGVDDSIVVTGIVADDRLNSSFLPDVAEGDDKAVVDDSDNPVQQFRECRKRPHQQYPHDDDRI